MVRRRARAAGIVHLYTDGLGTERQTPLEAVEALLGALGADEEQVAGADGMHGKVIMARAGSRVIRWPRGPQRRWRGRLELEDGGGMEARGLGQGRVEFEAALPLGVHRLEMQRGNGRWVGHVLAPPRTLGARAVLGGGRLGVFVPLHALEGPFGVGTMTDLRELVTWARTCANAFVGTLPLFPTFLDRPFDPSPYAPVSRLFWNELFVDPRRAEEWGGAGVQRVARGERFMREAAACRRGEWVDYRRSWRLMRRALAAMSIAARRNERRWKEVRRLAGSQARQYAMFRAGVESTGSGWQEWKASWRRGRIPSRAVDARAVDMYVYAQALATEQMGAVAGQGGRGSPLYLDLPVGVHASGYDVWRYPELFLEGVSAGAPPDGLHNAGQVWGFPPMNPTAGRADGYAHLRSVLRRMFSVAGVVRIDHVMWLERMYCVMPGFGGAEGAYLRYPAKELMGIVMIEAARAGGVVVGEDLGTVTDSIRGMMRRHGVLGMHVQQFALGDGPRRAIRMPASHHLASLNTHDTPTFAGYWTGADIDLRASLGQIDRAAARRERAGRVGVKKAVRAELKAIGGRGPTNPVGVGLSLMRVQARSEAAISLVNIEDLWGETRPQNVPGTTMEYPNWRRRMKRGTKDIVGDPRVNKAMTELAAERAGAGSGEGRRGRGR